ncbi:MAG: hypothetical protein R6X33_09215 [Candidatus Brocadiia bacterium]
MPFSTVPLVACSPALFFAAGAAPSELFQDDDGTVYLLWGGGRIARMKPDMSGVVPEDAENWHGLPSLIDRPDGTRPLDDVGGWLTKMKGRYVLLFNRWGGTRNMKLEQPAGGRYYGTYDYEACHSKELFGPYSRPHVAVPHGGHGNVFQDKQGRWWATMFCNDGTAPWPQGTVLHLPLEVEEREGMLHIDVADHLPAD